MRFLVSAITLGSLFTASPALAEPSRVALRTTITELSRTATPATATATYAVTVLPAGRAARGAVLRLRTASGSIWTSRPTACRTVERGAGLVCPLGDLTDPATLRIGVSAPAKLNAVTSLAVIAVAEATNVAAKVSPRPTPPVTPAPPGKPAQVAKPAQPGATTAPRPSSSAQMPGSVGETRPRPTAGPALPAPVPALPSAAPLLPGPPAPQLAVPGIPPGPQAQLIAAEEQETVLSDPRTWMSAVGLLLGAEALLLWIWMVFFLRRSLSASRSVRGAWR